MAGDEEARAEPGGRSGDADGVRERVAAARRLLAQGPEGRRHAHRPLQGHRRRHAPGRREFMEPIS